MYVLKLDAVPNPDFGETTRPAPTWVRRVRSLRAAVRLADLYIEEYNLGAGNFGAAVEHEDGSLAATISYNRRIWDPFAREILP